MKGEDLVVGVLRNDRLAGNCELRANDQGQHTADEEGRKDRDQVHHSDAFVVERDEPAQNAAGGIQVVARRGDVRRIQGRHRVGPFQKLTEW